MNERLLHQEQVGTCSSIALNGEEIRDPGDTGFARATVRSDVSKDVARRWQKGTHNPTRIRHENRLSSLGHSRVLLCGRGEQASGSGCLLFERTRDEMRLHRFDMSERCG